MHALYFFWMFIFHPRADGPFPLSLPLFFVTGQGKAGELLRPEEEDWDILQSKKVFFLFLQPTKERTKAGRGKWLLLHILRSEYR